ncbi:CvpA family protein [Hymenobacter psychrotolerans]|uniref:Membrane protein required for colicin V production n=1 Tax=Hymenobacter psychrotolerans DSM 18569 TaxID=1121959 RepID=A0A1M6P2L8_9BACT|nr:CvpA family protein [Hymenobacter psychrotolerans]SHK02133.1 membrane protein required for colicin V production [Hymenobacter psychrotolerans DSM 18569]
MSAFDILLLLPLGIGAVKGFRRGLVLEVASLLAFILGAIGGLVLLNDAIPLVRHYVGEAFGLLPFVTFVLVFVAIVWGVHLLGSFVKKAVHLTPLGMLDNLGGGLAGVLKWVLGLSLLLHGVGMAGVQLIAPTLLTDSQVLPLVHQATPVALEIVGFILPFAGTLLDRLREAFTVV